MKVSVLCYLWLLALACVSASFLADFQNTTSSRIVEKPIGLQTGELKTPKRISGYFQLDRTYDAHMFYFYFESRSSSSKDPVVLWMTGGPGCSSELAVFYENGPYHITDDLKVSESKYGWDVSHNMVYVDQPIGTGFSYSEDQRDEIYDEAGVSQDMLEFILEFLKVHPELADRDFFVTGESYGGHYVPAVSSKIYLYNKEASSTEQKINLKGFAIGNGLTDPAIQYSAYADFALANGLISQTLRDRLQMIAPICEAGLRLCDGLDWRFECELTVEWCQLTVFAPIMAAAGNINVYDIRKECEGPLCYDFSAMDQYLNLPEVQKALGVKGIEWQACSPDVYQDMMGDWGHNFDTVIPAMLADGIRVLIYAGVEDFICNWLGNERWLAKLPWEGLSDWTAAPYSDWSVNGSVAGSGKSVGPLTFLKVNGAGHMVPMDQPEVALEMITDFTRGKTIVDSGAQIRSSSRKAGPSDVA